MEYTGLVEGTAGNVSCLHESRRCVLITPTGVDYDELAPWASETPFLQNHGVIAVGTSAPKALNVAQVVEYTAELLWRAQSIGTPSVLSDEEMERVAHKSVSYGQPYKATEDLGAHD
jgi:ribulose-5-phosphate 4-epimerase/fuculose-1-phosphate aldolase